MSTEDRIYLPTSDGEELLLFIIFPENTNYNQVHRACVKTLTLTDLYHDIRYYMQTTALRYGDKISVDSCTFSCVYEDAHIVDDEAFRLILVYESKPTFAQLMLETEVFGLKDDFFKWRKK